MRACRHGAVAVLWDPRTDCATGPTPDINCGDWSGGLNPTKYQFVAQRDRKASEMALILTCPKDPPKGNRFCGFQVESLRGTAENAPVVVSPEGAPVITVESTGRASSASRSGRTVEYTIRGG